LARQKAPARGYEITAHETRTRVPPLMLAKAALPIVRPQP